MSSAPSSAAAAAAAPAPAASPGVDGYDVVCAIGRGSFGTVSKVVRRSDGRVLVWKELSYGAMSEAQKALVVSEVNILRELRHPFIVRYYDRLIDKATARMCVAVLRCVRRLTHRRAPPRAARRTRAPPLYSLTRTVSPRPPAAVLL